jgi:hypothetical protein
MATIHIRTKLESETLILPELKLLIGKTINISVSEHVESTASDRWAKATEAVKQLTDYDFSAASEQRTFDTTRVEDHLS